MPTNVAPVGALTRSPLRTGTNTSLVAPTGMLTRKVNRRLSRVQAERTWPSGDATVAEACFNSPTGKGWILTFV